MKITIEIECEDTDELLHHLIEIVKNTKNRKSDIDKMIEKSNDSEDFLTENHIHIFDYNDCMGSRELSIEFN